MYFPTKKPVCYQLFCFTTKLFETGGVVKSYIVFLVFSEAIPGAYAKKKLSKLVNVSNKCSTYNILTRFFFNFYDLASRDEPFWYKRSFGLFKNEHIKRVNSAHVR